MKTVQAIQTILTLGAMVLAASSQGQVLLYDDGPVNGTSTGYTIDNGYTVADSFTLGANATVGSATVAIWNANYNGDSLVSLHWSITTAPFGGTTLASGTAAPTDTFLFRNNVGGLIYSDHFSITPTALAAGTYWFALDDAVDESGFSTGWDYNNGPSTAYQENGGGTYSVVGSESFQLYAVPEPCATALVLVGGLSLVCLRRRK